MLQYFDSWLLDKKNCYQPSRGLYNFFFFLKKWYSLSKRTPFSFLIVSFYQHIIANLITILLTIKRLAIHCTIVVQLVNISCFLFAIIILLGRNTSLARIHECSVSPGLYHLFDWYWWAREAASSTPLQQMANMWRLLNCCTYAQNAFYRFLSTIQQGFRVF